MADNASFLKRSKSMLGEIEEQLDSILDKKKGEIEKDLEDKIQKEKEYAMRRIKEFEKEMAVEKISLVTFRKILSEFEVDSINIKEQTKEHLDKAFEIIAEIERKVSVTVKELKKVQDLSQQQELLNQEAVQRMESFKSDLEKKQGIDTEILDREQKEEVVTQIENELERLSKIKELLVSNQDSRTMIDTKLEHDVQESEIGNLSESNDKVSIPDKKRGIKASKKSANKKRKKGSDNLVSTLQEELNKYRKYENPSSGLEISYYENQERMTLDSENIIATIDKNVDEVTSLHDDFTQTESPGERFSFRKKIKEHQETVRNLLLNVLRMTDNDSCDLPQYTRDILNTDSIKTLLEKLSFEEWSNHEKFTSFLDMFHDKKEEFYKRITPPSHYLESIMKELWLIEKD